MASTASVASIDEILALARRNGVVLWAEAGDLRFRARPGALTGELRAALSARKTEIIAALSRPVFKRRPLADRFPIISYHRGRWENIRSGYFGIEFVNSPHAAVRIRGELDLSSLRRSLSIVVARHPILRARVVDAPDGPEFVVDTEPDIPVEVIDLSTEDASERETVARDVVTGRIWMPFDADSKHWLRVFVVKLGEADQALGFVIHHFIADGASVGIFLQELLQAYAAIESATAPALAELPFQYLDYVAGMNEWIQSDAARISASFWREYLRDAPATLIPPTFEVDTETYGLLATQSARTSPEAVADLQSFCRFNGMTLHALVAAAFVGVMAHQSKAQDIVLVIRTHGRDDPALLPLIGAFFDAMALRVFVTREMSFQALATCVWNELTRSSVHQIYPHHLVVPALSEVGASSIAPMLNFMDLPARSSATPAARDYIQPFPLAPRPPVLHPARRHIGFYTQISARSDGVRCKAEYMSVLYKEQVVAGFVRAICRVLEQGPRHPERSVRELLDV